MKKQLQPLDKASGDIDVSVTIVSTNEYHYIEAMLPQLYASATGIRMEVLVVDNVCTDQTSELEQNFPSLTVLHNTHRETFCVNHNKAILASKGRYVLCLNPDMLFDRTDLCIARMVGFMDTRPECGISGCQSYNLDGQFAYPARRFQTLRIVLARRLERFFGDRKVLDNYLYRDMPIESTFEADWLSGCFLLIRRKALQQVGLFDIHYKKYFEDVDICRRMAASGWKVLYHGETGYTHLEQRASTNLLSKSSWLHLKSWARWIRRQRYYRELDVKSKINKSKNGVFEYDDRDNGKDKVRLAKEATTHNHAKKCG